MPDDGVAVLDAPDVSVNTDISTDVPNESTSDAVDGVKGDTKPDQADKQDGRKQPDALKKRVADLRRQADSITDPTAKAALLADAKALNDTIGKARAYEEQFPTVREVREVKALLDSVGGREGFTQMQTTLSEVADIDAKLTAGDPSVIERMWQEAPEGMPKLVPAIADKFAKEKPQEYQQFIAPRAIAHLDQSGFPQAFDRLVQLYESGKVEDAKALKQEMIAWVTGQRQQQTQQKQVDPEVERLRAQLAEREHGDETKAVDGAYNAVVTAAGPILDSAAKPLVARLKLTAEEYKVFRGQVWDHLQTTRNANPTYKTIAPAKQKAGYDKWTEYANRWTQDNAEDSVRAILKTPPWSRLATASPVAVTTSPAAKTVQQGKEPLPSEIDYGPRGIQAARKAGFRDLQDMLLAGQAPLKVGGIRKWR